MEHVLFTNLLYYKTAFENWNHNDFVIMIARLFLLVRKDMDVNKYERLSNITLRHKLK